MSSSSLVCIGVAQVPARIGDVAENLEIVTSAMDAAAQDGVRLLVFPECALTGYIFETAEQVRGVALPQDDPVFERLTKVCRSLDLWISVGFLERSPSGVHNSVCLIGPDGVQGSYRKTHIPALGADHFVLPGRQLEPPVFRTPMGRVGLLICYDLRFPEHARCLALKGADIIAMSTNWPEDVSFPGDFMTRVRAAENHVFLAVANRPDVENGVSFRGRSQIVDPEGELICLAGQEVGVHSATIDPLVASDKGALFRVRQPDLYSSIVEATKQ